LCQGTRLDDVLDREDAVPLVDLRIIDDAMDGFEAFPVERKNVLDIPLNGVTRQQKWRDDGGCTGYGGYRDDSICIRLRA
jgi:hypothetical protein